ncbi:hypothetical protein Tco_0390260 [Tanacetum coccineum]
MWCLCDLIPSGWCKTDAHSMDFYLKDFLKLVDSLDLDVTNRERTRLRLFQFFLRDQASNWIEHLPAGSISTWEDLTTRGPTAQMNFTSTDYHTKEELRSKGIKILSKLLSPKYLSQSSKIEQNKNPSSPKRVHFVNSIVILNKENEAEEEGSVEPSKTEYTSHENANETGEEVKSEKEVEEETKGETEEEKEDDPKHFDTFLTMKS